MNELVRIDREGRKVRVGLHAGQRRAWRSEARFVAILAGTQSGKTSFAPYWLLREMRRKGPGDYLFVTPTFSLLELKALPELLRVFGQALELGRYTTTPRRAFVLSKDGARRLFGDRASAAGSPLTRVVFGFATEPESLESATALAAVCDEAGQRKFKLESWEAILRRLSLARGRVLITTSVYNLGWLKTRYERWRAGDPDWQFIQFESTMNPSFPLEEFERARRDLPRWRFDMLYRGLFTRPAGLIYDCYDPVQHRCPRFPIPLGWPRFAGLDFGKTNTAAVFLAQEPETHRFFLYRTYHTGGKSAAGHVRALLQGEPRPSYIAGGAPGEDERRHEFRAAGLPVREPPIAAVEVGIDRVYGLIQRGELVVFDDLDELNDELTSYSRALNDRGEPTEMIDDKSSYHLLDALRYALVKPAAPGRARVVERQIEFYPSTL